MNELPLVYPRWRKLATIYFSCKAEWLTGLDTRTMISLRKCEKRDEQFLYGLYFSSRREEMESWGWAESQMQAFAEFQFRSRSMAYAEKYPEANDRIILLDDKTVGRMMVNRTATELRLIDIALLPEHQGRGLGTEVLRGLIDEANREHLSIGLHVEVFNKAKRLYDRLGFEAVGEHGGYFQMEHKP